MVEVPLRLIAFCHFPAVACHWGLIGKYNFHHKLQLYSCAAADEYISVIEHDSYVSPLFWQKNTYADTKFRQQMVETSTGQKSNGDVKWKG